MTPPSVVPSVPADALRIAVVNADPATLDLLKEWLGAAGYRVVDEPPAREDHAPVAVAIVDVPFARHRGPELLREVAARHPGAPILALSPTFFSNVQCGGGCARALGVAGVLPKPLARDVLLAAVERVLRPLR